MILTKKKTAGNQAGMASFIVAMTILSLGLIIILGLTFLVTNQHKIATNSLKSKKAYAAAEAGIEDALLRIRKGLTIPAASYNINADNSQAVVDISNAIGGSRTITSQGQNDNVFRRLEVIQSLNGEQIQFFFGAQVDAGGILMNNVSTIDGNVFSNGNITAGVGSGQSITGDVIIANNGNKIEGITVDDGDPANNNNNVQVHTCKDSTIAGTLTYVSGGSVINCTAGGGVNVSPNQIDPEPLPISDSQINNWKAVAAINTYAGDYALSGTETASLGPLKIEGNLTLNNSAILTLTGTLWVTGNIDFNQSVIVQLNSGSYGEASGVIVADGTVDLDNSVVIQGTGQPGSYLLLLSTNPANPAMSISNSAAAGVFYASNGFINIQNNVFLREVTAYGLTLGNNVTIQYDIGMANLFFSSGPGGGWKIENWQEIP